MAEISVGYCVHFCSHLWLWEDVTGESYESNRPPIHGLLLVSLGKLYNLRLHSTQNKTYVSKVGFPEHYYTSYFFIRIPQIGLASVFLIFGQIKLKIILNLYPS